MSACSKCGFENPDGMKFCGNCAAPFASRCSNCGFENPPTFKFCGQCGNPLQAGTPARPGSPGDGRPADRSIRITPERPLADVPDEERKTVTALFADIKGSMDLMEELDPEEARAIVDPALRLMIDSVNHYNGYIVQSTGDGIFALFGAPIALRGSRPSRIVCGAQDADRDAQIFGAFARSRQSSARDSNRCQYRRGRRPFDPHRRRAHGIHTHRPLNESGRAHANPRPHRLDRDYRGNSEVDGGLFRPQVARPRARQGRERTGKCL